ncbi:MAG: glycogen synthase, partial [Clostridia bacterium]|nr:glycogen synthase [Clostridia bacterium]
MSENNNKAVKVLFVASEALPFASTGGLADVIGSLPPILKQAGVDARVIIPYYSIFKQKNLPEISFMFDFRVQLAWRDQYCGIFTAEHNGVTFYFVDNEYYFKRMALYGSYDDGERYAFFSKAVLDVLPKLENGEGFFPDIIHTNDWQTALVGIYLKQVYRKLDYRYRPIRVVHSIHNIEYQGVFGHHILGDVFDLDQEYASIVDYNGAINLTKGAVVCCDRLTTVSPTYANQIKTPEYASGLHHIINQYAFKTVGIINGIDQDYYDPSKDPDIYKTYKTVRGKAKNKAALQAELRLPENPDTP